MEDNLLIIKIADICIGLKPLNNGWDEFCKDYMTDEEPDFIVEPTEEEISAEQRRIAEYMDVAQYGSFEAEKLWIYGKIAEMLPAYDAFLIHGAAVKVDENAYLFLGPSGAGKTTHARLWKKYFGNRLRMINDDKPIIKVEDDKILACGSPWSGKERWKNNISAPVMGGICIHQAETDSIKSMTMKESWELIMRQAYRTQNTENMKKTLRLFDKVIKTVPFYSLNCTRKNDAVELAYTKLQKK